MPRLFLAIALAAAFGLFSRPSWAQDRSIFFQDPQTPATISADRLSVSNRNQTATFSGHVVVTQGAARMRCASLVVHYQSDGPDHHSMIDRFECKQDYLHLIGSVGNGPVAYPKPAIDARAPQFRAVM